MTSDTDPAIELVCLDDLKPADRNPRTHDRKQIDKIVRSIRTYGFTNPVLIDEDNRILAGHGRLAAARKIGMKEVPCLRLAGMSAAQKRAYVIADNQLALAAGWNTEVLADQLGELILGGFDVELTGFDQVEVDTVLSDQAARSTKTREADNNIPARPSEGQAVCRVGDAWQLGRHRLICGDAKDPAVLARLMDGDQADMIFTDVPYNLSIRDVVSTKGAKGHEEFVEASGEMSPDEFEAFLTLTLGNAAAVCCDGAIAYTFIDWRHQSELLAAGRASFTELKNLCVWVKRNGGMGSFYRSRHELVFVWKQGTAPHINTFGLGDKGRYRTNVWEYAGVNSFGASRDEELEMHPTVKPVALVMDAIRDVTHRGHVVLDVFGGSGTTLIAAESTGRACYMLELDPGYCDVIIRRYQRLTGKPALYSGSERTFEDLAGERGVANVGLKLDEGDVA